MPLATLIAAVRLGVLLCLLSSVNATAGPTAEQLARIEAAIAAESDLDQRARGMSTLAQLVARYGRATEAEAILGKYKPGIDPETLRFVVATELAFAGADAAALRLTEAHGPVDQLQIRLEIAKAQLALGRTAAAAETVRAARAAYARVNYKDDGDAGLWSERRDLYWLGKLQARTGLSKDLDETIAGMRRITRTLGKLFAEGRTKSPSNQLSDYELWVGLGELLALAGRQAEARREMSRAMKAAADPKATTGIKSAALTDISEAQHRAGLAADARATWKRLEALFATMSPQEQIDIHPDVPRDLAYALKVQGRIDAGAATLAKGAPIERFESLSWNVRRLIEEGRDADALRLLDHAERLAPPDDGRRLHQAGDLAQWADAMRAMLALKAGGKDLARRHLISAIERAKAPGADPNRTIEHWTNVALAGELARRRDGIEDLTAAAWEKLAAYVVTAPAGCCPTAPPSERLSWIAMHLWQHGAPPREGP